MFIIVFTTNTSGGDLHALGCGTQGIGDLLIEVGVTGHKSLIFPARIYQLLDKLIQIQSSFRHMRAGRKLGFQKRLDKISNAIISREVQLGSRSSSQKTAKDLE